MPRRPLDQFETPPHYVEPLLTFIGPLDDKRVYEPCVGQGHIAKYLKAGQLVTNDIDTSCPATTHLDARLSEAWSGLTFEWTITNPPFVHEAEILARALQCSRNVAFLARISFLEPTRSRQALWATAQPTELIMLPRYSFRLNDAGKRQTDNVTCCWMLFRQHRPPCVSFSLWRPSSAYARPQLVKV